jgi:hypothetical protein
MRGKVYLCLGLLLDSVVSWSFRGSNYRPHHFLSATGSTAPAPAYTSPQIAPIGPRPALGPAPSTISMANANSPQGVLPVTQNRAPCGQTASGTAAAATGGVAPNPMMAPRPPVGQMGPAVAGSPVAPAARTGWFFMSRAGPAPAAAPVSGSNPMVGMQPMGRAAPMPGAAPMTAQQSQGNACVVQSSSAPEAENKTGTYIAIAVGALFGLITIAAIVQKYKTMGSYSSFWGRMIALASGAIAFAMGYIDVSHHSANDCSNLFGEAEFDSPCPCLACGYLLFVYGAFQLIFNLPFLYANEKTISNLYAKFGLFNQAAVELTVSGGCAGGIKFMSGGLMEMVVCALGCVTAVLFLLGWFKGEDGALGRLFQSAKDMLNDAANAAAAMVDDGLKVFGLNADERNKVTMSNVYNFCRVVRGPDWSAGDDDGGPEGPGGEVVGYIGENGVAEGVAVSAGQPGWAKVKWDPKIPGQQGKTAEYRIGAGNKFELKMAEENEGIVDKLMGQTFAMFGYDPNSNKGPPKDKQQIEFILTSRLPGEEEPEKEGELNNDSGDEDASPSSKKAEEKAIAAAKAEAEAASKDTLVMACDVFDKTGKNLGRCDEVKQMLFKSAVRHRNLGNKQEAIVVELQKIPEDVAVIAVNIKVPEGRQLGHFGSLNIRATSQGHDLSKLSVPAAEGAKSISKHQGSRGYLWFLLYSPEPGKWFAEKTDASLGSGQPVDALNEQVAKFIAAREPKIPKSKKKAEEYESTLVGGKSVENLISISEIFEYLKIELRCEAQAREMMNSKVNVMTEAYTTKLKSQGVPEAQAKLQAKKLALIQIHKQHQLIYQKTLVIKRAMYMKQRIHPVHALIMAKKDANRAALFDGKEAEIRRAVMNTIKEEKEATEAAQREQDAAYADTYTGKASALASSLWGWATTEDDSADKHKKKKKKKKKDEEGEEEASAPVAPKAAALPPQFQNLKPEQIAALRAMQAKQQAAAAAPKKQ